MLSVHKQALQNRAQIVLHEFYLSYEKKSTNIYCFVEGIEDPSFYRGLIDQCLPDEWNCEMWATGCKNDVYFIYKSLDWRVYIKNQVLFFVDCDLSVFLNFFYPKSTNIYITDHYSIENFLVSSKVFERVIKEMLGFGNIKRSCFSLLLSMFKDETEKFQIKLAPLMASIIYWRRHNIHVNLNNILMKDLFYIQNGKLISKQSDIVDFVCRKYSISTPPKNELDILLEDFLNNKYYAKFTRGKYLMWFFVEFCLSIYKHCCNLPELGYNRPPKISLTLSQKNALIQIAPRCPLPKSLGNFIEKNITKLVN